MATRRRGTLIHALEKRLREREREDSSGRARPPIYWSLPFAPRRLHPSSKCSCSMHGHAKTKEQARRQAKKKMKGKACQRQVRKRCQTRANKLVKHTKRQTNILSNKRGCPRRTNVGLDRVSIATLDWSMGDTQSHAWTCWQACKDTKKQRNSNGWHKASKASISTSHGVEKGVYQAHQHHGGDNTLKCVFVIYLCRRYLLITMLKLYN